MKEMENSIDRNFSLLSLARALKFNDIEFYIAREREHLRLESLSRLNVKPPFNFYVGNFH